LTLDELKEDLLVSIFGETGIDTQRVNFNIPDPNTRLYCDKTHISAALLEMVYNASKYAPSDSAISVEMTNLDGAISLSVTDEGRSVESDKASGLFDAFERGDSWGDSYQRGAGLGLPFVSMIAQSHSGEAWFRKSKTGTSIFRLTLPFAG